MAGTICKMYYHFCSRNFGGSLIQRNFPSFRPLYLTQTRKLNICKVSYLSNPTCVEKSGRTFTGKNDIFASFRTSQRNITYRKLTSDTPSNLERKKEMRDHLLHLFTKDRLLSPKQQDTFMNITDVIIESHDSRLPSDKLQGFASQAYSQDLYYLGSLIRDKSHNKAVELHIFASPLFQLAASLGHRDARYQYGRILRRGVDGVDPDPVEAANIFTNLANKGHGKAEFDLATMFYSGDGVEQSFEKCLALYKTAAESGIIESYDRIGKLYIMGQGVSPDEVEAGKYFTRGAEAGDKHACMSLCYLGQHILNNNVGDEGIVLATPYFKLAASLGHIGAMYQYGHILLRGADGVDPDPVEAANIFTSLANKGHGHAQFDLASMFYSGDGVEQSFEKCLALYKTAAESGIIESYDRIGKMYLDGLGVSTDEVTAVKYFMRGAEAGDTNACMSLGSCYSSGKGVAADAKKSFEYNMKAADNGHAPAIHNVGTYYSAGNGVDLDISKALEYFQKSADLGFTLSLVNLGHMYYDGFGVKKDREKAKELYQRAAALKDKMAISILENLEQKENIET